MSAWIVQVPNPATPWTAHDTEAEADREVVRLGGPTKAVAWWCSNLSSAAVSVPVGEIGGSVAPGATGDAKGPQIGTQGVAGVVERALGHLGFGPHLEGA